MAVTEVVERWAGRKGGKELAKGKREYARTFRVQTNNVYDGGAVVRLAAGIPRVGDVYAPTAGEYDTGAFCTKVEVQQHADSPYYWDVTATYSSDLGELEQVHENPLLRPSQITGTFARFQKAVERDRDGFAIVNSAGDPFDPPVEIDDSRPTITIQRNEATLNYALMLTYKDAVNSDTFLGFAPGVVKVAGLGFQGPLQENGIWYWAKSYEFELRAEGWALRLLDQGLRESVVGDNPRLIRDLNGQPVARPVLLDGNGDQLDDGGTPVFLTFPVYPVLPFAALSLP